MFTNIKYIYVLVKSVKKINNYINNALSLQMKNGRWPFQKHLTVTGKAFLKIHTDEGYIGTTPCMSDTCKRFEARLRATPLIANLVRVPNEQEAPLNIGNTPPK